MEKGFRGAVPCQHAHQAYLLRPLLRAVVFDVSDLDILPEVLGSTALVFSSSSSIASSSSSSSFWSPILPLSREALPALSAFETSARCERRVALGARVLRPRLWPYADAGDDRGSRERH